MSGFEIRKASAARAKIRAALHGVPGSGKTLGALLFGRGLVGPKGRIIVIDTERARSEQYDRHPDYPELGEFDVLPLEPPHGPDRFLGALRHVYGLGYDLVVLDSLSHEWAGVGGVLEKVDSNKGSKKGKGNDFSAWNGPSQDHQRVISTIVMAPCHILVTLRTKMAYEIVENDRGKKVPQKLGLAPVAREGTEYEFDLGFEVDQDHHAHLAKCNLRFSRLLAEALAVEPKLTIALGSAVRGWIAELPEAAPPAPSDEDAREAALAELLELWKTIPGDAAKREAFLARRPNAAVLGKAIASMKARAIAAAFSPEDASSPAAEAPATPTQALTPVAAATAAALGLPPLTPAPLHQSAAGQRPAPAASSSTDSQPARDREVRYDPDDADFAPPDDVADGLFGSDEDLAVDPPAGDPA